MASKPAEPSDRPLLSYNVVAAYRRERIVRATAESAHDLGLRRLAVGDILRRSKMARSSFYAVFPTKVDALEFACQEATDFLLEAVREVGQGECPSREAVIDRFIDAVQDEPLLAELCLLHSKSAPIPEPDRFLAALTRGLREGLGETRFSELVALAIVQAVTLQLARGSAADLSEARDALIGMTARPDSA
jgi:AcrR family transcriptional regulator